MENTIKEAEGKGRRAVRLGLVAFALYVGYSVWRLQSVADYQNAIEEAAEVEGSFPNALAEFYATSSELVLGSYVVLLLFAGAIFLCVWKGETSNDVVLLKWSALGSLGCVLLLLFTLINLALTGTLCTSVTSEDSCDFLTITFVASLVATSVLFILYFFSFTTTLEVRRDRMRFLNLFSPQDEPPHQQPRQVIVTRELSSDNAIIRPAGLGFFGSTREITPSVNNNNDDAPFAQAV
mmetsp:Transcript_9914/g.18282  ORF Transcript_9914/g.18282 Transcript_9914/m.18282 type:complete len:237 (-) Transcript_9914:26-736(-)